MVAEAGARSSGLEGTIAAPMLADGEVKGVIGVGKQSEHEFTADELLRMGRRIAERW